MKNFVWLFGCLLLIFLGDRAGGLIMDSLMMKSQFRYSRLYKGEATSDVLFVGNSRGLMFYQPYLEEKTGFKTLNISYNALPSDLAKNIILDYFQLNGLPKMVVIEITMCDRINKKLLAGFQPYRKYSKNLQDLINKQTLKSYNAGELSHLYRYNSEIFHRSLFYLNESDEDWLLDRVINNHLIEKVEEIIPDTFRINEYALQNLLEIVKITEENQVKLQLIVNPYFPPYAQKLINLDEEIKRVENVTGLSVLNYSQSIKNPNGFGDYQHLNKFGSKLFVDNLIIDGMFDSIISETLQN